MALLNLPQPILVNLLDFNAKNFILEIKIKKRSKICYRTILLFKLKI